MGEAKRKEGAKADMLRVLKEATRRRTRRLVSGGLPMPGHSQNSDGSGIRGRNRIEGEMAVRLNPKNDLRAAL
jgi:hypothetical protein